MLTPRYIAGLLCAAAAASSAMAQPSSPVVLELFTSEGCSSCVAADSLFNQIERGQVGGWRSGADVITLGEHVDYWDSEEWRDRFSSPLFSSRQQDYGRAFRAQDVFTPQVVVNGQSQCIGSDWSCIQRAVQEASKQAHAVVGIHNGPSVDTISVSVQHLPASTSSADVLLSITESGLDTSILGGENRGRRAIHSSVVRSMTQLARIKNGNYTADVRLTLNPRWNRQNVRAIILVQDRTNRRILGAASARP